MEFPNNQYADEIDKPLTSMNAVPCEIKRGPMGATNCIDPQLARRTVKAKGWHDVDPKKMCASCACYWHLSCARNYALGVYR